MNGKLWRTYAWRLLVWEFWAAAFGLSFSVAWHDASVLESLVWYAIAYFFATRAPQLAAQATAANVELYNFTVSREPIHGDATFATPEANPHPDSLWG